MLLPGSEKHVDSTCRLVSKSVGWSHSRRDSGGPSSWGSRLLPELRLEPGTAVNGILLISIALRVIAMAWSFALIRRLREWRMGFLTVMLLFMASRQILTLLSSGGSRPGLEGVSQASEVPGLVVSVMALFAVHGLQRVFENRRRNEEKRRELEAQLQHAQRLESLGVLAGGIAHDFNNLLTPVLIHASILKDELRDHESSRERAEGIETAATHAAELCDQMLAFSGRGRYQLEPVDLSKLVESIGRLLDVGIPANVTVESQLASELPPIRADARQLQQVIMNLITNASDATAETGGRLTIRTGVWNATRAYLSGSCVDDDLPEGEYAYLEVADTGSGMEAETVRRMFDPFFTTKSQGLGLGMAAVLGIVRGHRGAIRVESRPGEGTTIRSLFPVFDGNVEADDSKDRAGEFDGSGLLLVADDDAAVRTAAVSVLEAAGFTVLQAVDGCEALTIAQENRPDLRLILLDLSMPCISGKEVFARLRMDGNNVPVILSSGFDEEDISDLSDHEGSVQFLHKPYRASELIEKVGATLNRAQSAIGSTQLSSGEDRLTKPGKCTILVVDDETAIRRSLCDLIDAMGYGTLDVDSGQAAIDVCQERAGEIGLVILDLQMPGMSGVETLLRLVEMQPHLPVVLCHGGSDDQLSSATRDLLSGVLKKPFQVEQLESLLTTLLPASCVES